MAIIFRHKCNNKSQSGAFVLIYKLGARTSKVKSNDNDIQVVFHLYVRFSPVSIFFISFPRFKSKKVKEKIQSTKSQTRLNFMRTSCYERVNDGVREEANRFIRTNLHTFPSMLYMFHIIFLVHTQDSNKHMSPAARFETRVWKMNMNTRIEGHKLGELCSNSRLIKQTF